MQLGTVADNNNDTRIRQPARLKRGRDRYRGEKHPLTPFVEQDILAIRQLYAEGSTIADLARRFSVNYNAIKKIVRRVSWAHI